MKKLLLSFLIIFYFVGVFAQDKSLCKSKTIQAFEFIKENKIDSVYLMFDEVMQSKVSKGNLDNIFNKLETGLGNLQNTGKISTKSSGSYLVVFIPLEFENGKLDFKVSFNSDNKISGLFFVPHKNREGYILRTDSVLEESKITVESGEYKLPGILCIPKEKDNYNIVVLVHGSGPNNMNQKVGPNLIFKDIAHGLAEKGIASIRYDKRTYAYPGLKADSITLDEATIIDAISAVNLAKKQSNVSKVFVIGHSLGAMSAPRIAERVKTDGIIMMASNFKPLYRIVPEQYEYIYSIDGLSKGEKQMIKEEKRKANNVERIAKGETFESNDLPLGASQYYWKYVLNYNHVETLDGLDINVLILQGERDYQVTMDEFISWKKNFKDKPNVKLISYSGLNHLFIYGEEKSKPQEYKKEGNVSDKVIEDMANWINATDE